MDERHINDKEVWKDIPGFDGRYQASTFGRIRSVDVVKEYVNFKGTNCQQRKVGKVLKPYPQAGGYMTVTLYDDGVENFMFVHRLLALTFLENKRQMKIVSFKDGNKYNVTLDNLCWGKPKKTKKVEVLK